MGVIPPEDQAYYARGRELLEAAYLAGGDPRRQSGFSGNDAKWEWLRRPITRAFHKDGTFLDIGCANGYLMECARRWAADDGRAIEPYGLEVIPSLAELARRRLPLWADRIHTGNVMAWDPPRGYDFVRSELGYVPDHRRPDLVSRLLDRFVLPGGRLIMCSYGSTTSDRAVARPVAGLLTKWGFDVAGSHEEIAGNGRIGLRLAWVDRNPRSAVQR